MFRQVIYIMSQKFPTFKLFVKNLTDFQNFCTADSVWNLLENTYDTTHLILGRLLHYLGKFKSQILVDIQQAWIKMQINCIFKFTAFNFFMRVTVYAKCIYVLAEYLKY